MNDVELRGLLALRGKAKNEALRALASDATRLDRLRLAWSSLGTDASKLLAPLAQVSLDTGAAAHALVRLALDAARGSQRAREGATVILAKSTPEVLRAHAEQLVAVCREASDDYFVASLLGHVRRLDLPRELRATAAAPHVNAIHDDVPWLARELLADGDLELAPYPFLGIRSREARREMARLGLHTLGRSDAPGRRFLRERGAPREHPTFDREDGETWSTWSGTDPLGEVGPPADEPWAVFALLGTDGHHVFRMKTIWGETELLELLRAHGNFDVRAAGWPGEAPARRLLAVIAMDGNQFCYCVDLASPSATVWKIDHDGSDPSPYLPLGAWLRTLRPGPRSVEHVL